MNKVNGDKATLREVYKLVEDTRKELTVSIGRLENKFDLLESGRITNLESKLANIEGRLFTGSSIIALIISIVIALISFIFKK